MFDLDASETQLKQLKYSKHEFINSSKTSEI